MPTVIVYQFTSYDLSTGRTWSPDRWGTLEGIKKTGGAPLLVTATEVDNSCVGVEIEGLTERGFDPGHRKLAEPVITPTEADEVR